MRMPLLYLGLKARHCPAQTGFSASRCPPGAGVCSVWLDFICSFSRNIWPNNKVIKKKFIVVMIFFRVI